MRRHGGSIKTRYIISSRVGPQLRVHAHAHIRDFFVGQIKEFNKMSISLRAARYFGPQIGRMKQRNEDLRADEISGQAPDIETVSHHAIRPSERDDLTGTFADLTQKKFNRKVIIKMHTLAFAPRRDVSVC